MLEAGLGNRLAFELLYERYFDKLVWFANGYLNDRQKAEDAVQEVFVKIIEQPESFDNDKKFASWVYTIAANICKQLLRNEHNRARIMNENKNWTLQSSTLHVNTDHLFLQQRLHETLALLSEKERHIYSLRFEQELSIKDIARIMQIPEGSIKSCLYYLLKKLSIQLKEFTHEK